MPLFPPGSPVAVVIDGRPLAAYARAYLAGGRVFAPVVPLFTRVADRFWFVDDTIVVQRDGHVVRVRLVPRFGGALNGTYVPAGPVLRDLGATVRYEPDTHRLIVRMPPAAVTSPTPFNPLTPSVAPSAVFTPAEPATPRPLWTGSPLPRRTALPFPPPL